MISFTVLRNHFGSVIFFCTHRQTEKDIKYYFIIYESKLKSKVIYTDTGIGQWSIYLVSWCKILPRAALKASTNTIYYFYFRCYYKKPCQIPQNCITYLNYNSCSNGEKEIFEKLSPGDRVDLCKMLKLAIPGKDETVTILLNA